MARTGNWLAPTPEHRARMLDMEKRTRHVRALVLLAVAGGTFVLALQWSWPVLAVFGGFAVLVPAINLAMYKSNHPERWLLIMLLLSVVAIGGLAAFSGGAHSAALPWLVLPVVAATTVFGPSGFLATLDAAVLVLAVIVLTGSGELPHEEQVVAATVVLVIAVGAYVWELMASDLRSRRRSVIDPLTGLLNRSTLEDRFEELRQQALVADKPVAIAVFDIDRFKSINDELGHQTGDLVLQEVAAVIRGSLRLFEPAYRLGGEEFLLVLPGMDESAAIAQADHVRRQVEASRPGGVILTVSAGIAAGTGEELEYQRLFELADERLYAAKEGGRNRVLPAPPHQQDSLPLKLAG